MKRIFVMEEIVANKEKTSKYKIFSLVFIFLTICALCLTIGFSAYSTTLAINGKALVRPIKEITIMNPYKNIATNVNKLFILLACSFI